MDTGGGGTGRPFLMASNAASPLLGVRRKKKMRRDVLGELARREIGKRELGEINTKGKKTLKKK